MSFDSNHVVLNTMPNVFVDVGLPTVDIKEHPANCPLEWRLSSGWRCISHHCQLDIVTIQGNITGDQYIRDVLQPVILHFDYHPLAKRPVYMDDNARPRFSRTLIRPSVT
jgi:hypothetical protein